MGVLARRALAKIAGGVDRFSDKLSPSVTPP